TTGSGIGAAPAGLAGLTFTCAVSGPAGYRAAARAVSRSESPGSTTGSLVSRTLDTMPNGPVTDTTWLPASRTFPVLTSVYETVAEPSLNGWTVVLKPAEIDSTRSAGCSGPVTRSSIGTATRSSSVTSWLRAFLRGNATAAIIPPV